MIYVTGDQIEEMTMADRIVALPGGSEFSIPVPAGGGEAGQVLCLGLRPDDLHTLDEPDAQRIKADVVERLGNRSVIYGNCEGASDAQICMIADGAADIWPGQTMGIGFAPAKAHHGAQDGTALDRRVDLRALAALA